MSKVHAWSFTALDLYILCPYKYYAERVKKEVKFVETEALKWGNYVHKVMEDYLLGRLEEWPSELPRRWQLMADAVKQMRGTLYVEHEMPINKDKLPSRWMAPDVWCRLKQDVVVVSPNGTRAVNKDWKTGKYKDHSARKVDQLVLSALVTFVHFPTVESVDTSYVWLDAGEPATSKTIYREDAEKLWAPYEEKVCQVQESFDKNQWPMRENRLCKNWCDVMSCPYNGRAKR